MKNLIHFLQKSTNYLHSLSLSLSLSLVRAIPFIVGCFALAIPFLSAQSGYILPNQFTVEDLGSDQLAEYNKVTAQEHIVSVKFVTMADLAATQTNGQVSIGHPDKGCTATLLTKHVEEMGDGNYYWHGEVVKEVADSTANGACDCLDGHANILKLNGKIIGTLSIDDDYYEIEDLGGEKNLLVKKDYSGLGYKCGVPFAEGGGFQEGTLSANSNSIQDRGGQNCPVNVLALYTPRAKDKVSNLEEKIRKEIQKTNQALRNSNVMEDDAELILVDIQEYDFNDSLIAGQSFNPIEEDMRFLLSRAFPYSHGNIIDSLRDVHEADIVVLYTNGPYGKDLGVAGSQEPFTPNAAVCIVQAPKGLGNWTTAHEIGHLFGCFHEKGHPSNLYNNLSNHPYKFEKGFLCKITRNTIMFSTNEHNTLGYYSNPNIEYKNKYLGVVDSSENYKVFKANGCVVANYRSSAATPLTVSWNAPNYACTCDPFAIGASVSGGGVGSYSLRWYTSPDGFDWGSPVGYSSSISLTVPGGCPTPLLNHLFVKLQVESADGQVVVRTKKIEAVSQIPGDPNPCRPPDEPINDDGTGSRSSDHSGNTQRVLAEAYPNPFTDELRLQFLDDEKSSSYKIEIFDAVGKLVHLESFKPRMGKDLAKINLRHLPNGVYTVRINSLDVKKITKIN